MSIKTIFYVPLKPAIKQFMLKQYGPEPLCIVGNNTLGLLVMMNSDKLPVRKKPVRPANRNEMLALRLPKRMQARTMSDEQREQLSRVLEKMFYDQLSMFIIAHSALTGSEWGALRCFADVYELHDAAGFDLYKEYKLWRDRKLNVVRDNNAAIQQWYEDNRISNENSYGTAPTL